jgi:hypothetical protein
MDYYIQWLLVNVEQISVQIKKEASKSGEHKTHSKLDFYVNEDSLQLFCSKFYSSMYTKFPLPGMYEKWGQLVDECAGHKIKNPKGAQYRIRKVCFCFSSCIAVFQGNIANSWV